MIITKKRDNIYLYERYIILAKYNLSTATNASHKRATKIAFLSKTFRDTLEKVSS